jgi:nifR3 family TIM-barrel protein
MIVECAPMAGYTNAAFRTVLADLGAKVLYTEMVSAAAIFYKNKKTLTLLEKIDGSAKQIVQLFGHVPEHFKYAIESGLLNGFDEININMGCPANKIVKNNEGAALMTNPTLARAIIETCVAASPLPISVKIRLGTRPPCDYVKFAQMCENAGAKKLIVHGRYASAGYSGSADYNAIAEIVRAVKIPVIANGDIKNLETAKSCLEITHAHGVMVGRALLPIYKKYFPNKLQILRGEKIASNGGISFGDTCIDNIVRLFAENPPD